MNLKDGFLNSSWRGVRPFRSVGEKKTTFWINNVPRCKLSSDDYWNHVFIIRNVLFLTSSWQHVGSYRSDGGTHDLPNTKCCKSKFPIKRILHITTFPRLCLITTGEGEDDDGGDDGRIFPEHSSPILHAPRDDIFRKGKSLTPIQNPY